MEARQSLQQLENLDENINKRNEAHQLEEQSSSHGWKQIVATAGAKLETPKEVKELRKSDSTIMKDLDNVPDELKSKNTTEI